ncbi:hypothetical protein BVRB_1g001900 [Beta vulgaris subsp. vulgaris]|uniref:uncharacterized protein LOC104900556 n=1 Tax=Beta vulgaris subsp. vulgaris TaxID=3555 RepID=UPI00053F8F49|nr:uncharacterized protein LOC104900556 [Beta vulgaris subsp. vulgaris]KMT20181.1 hypothetical protein BVRB_1g001900 [Beta vulgaris subsp. vulgaris]
MYNQLLPSRNSAFLSTIQEGDIQRIFFKCTKWQLEETLDPINCPYHYYCNNNYPGDYPSWVDSLAILFITITFLATAVFMVVEIIRGRKGAGPLTRLNQLRRYFLPSGPIFLPIILLIMGKGHRINSAFPLSYNGPAILHLVRISALAFDTETESDVKYVFLEASTISGECSSCVCRQQVLAVGGMLVYRGWSVTTALVVGTLIFRIFSRVTTESKRRTKLMKSTMESLSWILMTVECFYLLIIPPPIRAWTRAASFSGVFVLMCLQLLKRLTTSIVSLFNDTPQNAGWQ